MLLSNYVQVFVYVLFQQLVACAENIEQYNMELYRLVPWQLFSCVCASV